MADWRIYAFDLDGNGGMTLNDGDVRASAQPTRELSGHGALNLTLAPEQDITLTPWKSLMVAELDGSIRGAGVVSNLVDDGDGSLSVTCVGIPGYYAPLPADMNRKYRDVDPALVLRDMLKWAAGRGGTDVGLRYSAYKDTGVRVGNPDPPVKDPGKFRDKPPVMRPIPREPQKKDYPNYYLKGNKSAQVAKRKQARDKYNAAMKAWRTQRDAIKKDNKDRMKKYNDAKKDHANAVKEYRKTLDDAAVKVRWWDNPTIGAVVDDMAKHIDYRVVTDWSGGFPRFTLETAKRLGRRQTGLRFAVGENVLASPQVDWTGDTYATQVVFLGAGEGAAMIRGVANGQRDGLARSVFISDQSVRSKAAAQKRAQRALKWRQTMPQITDLTVRDDDNAPFGTFEVGDEIRVTDTSGRWAGTVDMWVRILAITESTEAAVATLTVTRADKGE